MERMKRNIEEANRALVEKPLLATSAERLLILNEIKSQYRDLPQPLQFSKHLSILLSKVSTPIEEYDLIAGRCVDRLLSDEEEEILAAFITSPDNPSNYSLMSSGHCTYSWELLATEGLVGLRARAEQRQAQVQSEEERIFLSGAIEAYGAISAYLLRYAEAAEQRGMHELAENLRCAATEKPDRFTVALQLLWAVTFINCAYVTKNPTLTVGRLDQILYPFYRADLEKGILTRERAAEYITDYYCKHNLIMGRGEHQVGDASNSTTFSRILCFDAPQYLMLAGTNAAGELAVNELTELFASCIVPTFKNPVIVVRYVIGMNERCPALWETLSQKALASASMMFYNDNNMLATWRRMGIDEQDVPNYSHFGCNWPTTGDNGMWMGCGPHSKKYNAYRSEQERAELSIPYMRMRTPHGWPEDFVEILGELSLCEEGSVGIEDFYRLFFERMGEFIDRKLVHYAHELEVRQRKPHSLITFGDCFLESSISTASCASACAKYHFQLQSFQMFGTVADCFIAVDQLVMIEKKLTLARLRDAVAANFEGYGDVLALCRAAEKYGMDTPLSNYHAKRLSKTAADLVIEKNRPYLERDRFFLVPCMQSDTWHLKTGEEYGATPNGRLAHTAYSQNTRPSNGACTNGLTAMLRSMLSLPHDGLLSGALNLDVDSKQFAGESGRAVFAALLATYLNAGGLHAQVTCTTMEDLLEAKALPEEHRDLRVRVTGYSGVFVDFPERLQNDMIERMK